MTVVVSGVWLVSDVTGTHTVGKKTGVQSVFCTPVYLSDLE